MSFGRNILWCNLGRPVRLGPVDGRALIFILLALFHWAIWTFVVAFLGILSLWLMERAGYTVPNLLRRIGVIIMGKSRPGQISRSIRSDN